MPRKLRRLLAAIVCVLLAAGSAGAEAPASQPGAASPASAVQPADKAAVAPRDEPDGADAQPPQTEAPPNSGEGGAEVTQPPPLPTAQELFDRYAPRLAIVRYAAKVGQQDGALRTAHQLGVLVNAEGLLLLPGHVQAMNLKPRNFRIKLGEEWYDGELLRREGPLNVSYARIVPPDAEADAEEEDAAGTSAPVYPPPVTFAEPVPLSIGDAVWVFGMLPEQAGRAKQLRRRRIAAILDEPSTVYVLDGPPTPAEAGGLVLTLDGRPAGVVGYELSRQQGGEIYLRHGLPLVFPAAQIATSLAEPREAETTATTQAWFGILMQPLHNDFKQYFGLEDETGFIISNVVRDSPAERAGLQRGDIVVEFDGEPVDVPNDLAVLTFTRGIRDRPIGTPIPMQYLRDGVLHDGTVELAAVPKTAAKADVIRQPAWGLQVRELTQDVVYLLNLPPDITGVVVDGVEPGGPAQGAGLRPGDIVREINSSPVDGLGAYGDATDQLAGMRSEKIVLFVQRGQRTGFTTLEPDWRLPARDDS